MFHAIGKFWPATAIPFDRMRLPLDSRLRQIADYFLAQKTVATIDPVAIGAKLLPHVFTLAIERDPASHALQLRIRLIGTAIDDAFGRPLKGHVLEEYIHGPRGAQVIDAFHHCAARQEPMWLRQIVQIPDKLPRFVEGVAIYIEPERIYGGLVFGEIADGPAQAGFESAALKFRSAD
jgi:hypothetical protein